MNPKIEEWAREQFESVNLGDERMNYPTASGGVSS